MTTTESPLLLDKRTSARILNVSPPTLDRALLAGVLAGIDNPFSPRNGLIGRPVTTVQKLRSFITDARSKGVLPAILQKRIESWPTPNIAPEDHRIRKVTVARELGMSPSSFHAAWKAALAQGIANPFEHNVRATRRDVDEFLARAREAGVKFARKRWEVE